jgi:SAM-dependent methyltransferase
MAGAVAAEDAPTVRDRLGDRTSAAARALFGGARRRGPDRYRRGVLDYDREAARYDESRGGEERAASAAAAVRELLPAGAAVVLDVACGTGIVTARLRGGGRRVFGADAAAGMLGLASRRLPGGVVRSDAAELPIRDRSCDAVVLMWLLHLLDPDVARRVVAEAARVLRAGGALITTVDKNSADLDTGSDIAGIVGPAGVAHFLPQADTVERVLRWGGDHGLVPSGDTTFVGLGQGRAPGAWRSRLPNLPWRRDLDPSVIADLRRQLAALPDQDRPRPDPVYQLIALSTVDPTR